MMNSIEIDGDGRVKTVALPDQGSDNGIGGSDYNSTDENGYDDSFMVAEPLKQAGNLSSTERGSTSRPIRTSVQNFLQTVPHLYTLSSEEIAKLKVMVREYDEMSVIIEEGLVLQHVYVLAAGTVEVMNSKAGLKRAFGHRRIGSMTAPNVFGLDDAILDTPSGFTYHASSACTLLLIPKDQIIALFAQSPIFANLVSNRALQTLPSFSVFQDFCRLIFGLTDTYTRHRGIWDEGYRLSIPAIVDIYRMCGTVYHRLVQDPRLDMDALRFSIQRLPRNITRTHILVVTTSMNSHIGSQFLADVTARTAGVRGSTMISVNAYKQRRCAWTLGNGGQTIVMMRDGFTDTIDFMTTLSMFIIEARKLRTRMNQLVSPSAVEILRAALGTDNEQSCSQVLGDLTFTPREQEGLLEVWGCNALPQLYDILLNREEYVVEMEPNVVNRFAPDPYANWSLTILGRLKKIMNIPSRVDLPNDVVVDIVFSSSRTLENLFCSKSHDIEKLVQRYRAARNGDHNSAKWQNDDDRYYYDLSSLLRKDSGARSTLRTCIESNGFVLFEDSLCSALVVDLIDVSALRVDELDGALQDAAAAGKEKSQNERRHFIINVDKTFGAQIESTLRALLLTFGDRVGSVNIVGKAAGLVGNHGDILLPSKLLFCKQSFGEDSTDEIRLCNRNFLNTDHLAPFLKQSPRAKINEGVCMTVPGFLFQSEAILKFYKLVHGCTGVEMQCSYVARQLEQCHRTGVLSHSVPSRYLFYFNKLPLGNADESVAESTAEEAVSAIYAISRAVLSRILNP